jgi:hypothetical protein
MKHVLPAIACCLLAVGCMGLHTSKPTPPEPTGPLYPETPTTAELVSYLNRTTANVNSLESQDLDIEIKADGRSFGIRGNMWCQKSRNFRLVAKMPALAKKVADIGSNDQEFWYWISQDNPPDLYHCSYADLARGNVRVPFPLHPDWMVESLGLGAPAPVGSPEDEQARGRTLQVAKGRENKTILLYERTRSLQGQPVLKVTELNNFEAKGTQPQVIGHYLYYEGQTKPVCYAKVTKVQYDAKSGTLVPQRIEFTWPAMNLSLAMTLGDIRVNDPNLASNTKVFRRQAIDGAKDVDLARATSIMSPAGIQRAGATR